MAIFICRPEQFCDTATACSRTQDSIPGDMLPPSDADSDASDADDVGPVCNNPNRQQRLREADDTEDSDNSNDSDTERK